MDHSWSFNRTCLILTHTSQCESLRRTLMMWTLDSHLGRFCWQRTCCSEEMNWSDDEFFRKPKAISSRSDLWCCSLDTYVNKSATRTFTEVWRLDFTISGAVLLYWWVAAARMTSCLKLFVSVAQPSEWWRSSAGRELEFCGTRCCQSSFYQSENRKHRTNGDSSDQITRETHRTRSELIQNISYCNWNCAGMLFYSLMILIMMSSLKYMFRSLWCFMTSLMDRSAVWSLLLIMFHPWRLWLQRQRLAEVRNSCLHNKTI